jgi:hypothetical protein
MLAQIPAHYPVTYRRLSQLQSRNYCLLNCEAQTITVANRSFKVEGKFGNTVREKFWSQRAPF